MILVDVGNTTIHFASERSGKIVKPWAIDTKSATLAAIKQSVFRGHTLNSVELSVCPRNKKRRLSSFLKCNPFGKIVRLYLYDALAAIIVVVGKDL